jgi:hypothetical protein
VVYLCRHELATYVELRISVNVGNYPLLLGFFPLIGLLMGLWVGAVANGHLTPSNDGPPRPPGCAPAPGPASRRP